MKARRVSRISVSWQLATTPSIGSARHLRRMLLRPGCELCDRSDGSLVYYKPASEDDVASCAACGNTLGQTLALAGGVIAGAAVVLALLLFVRSKLSAKTSKRIRALNASTSRLSPGSSRRRWSTAVLCSIPFAEVVHLIAYLCLAMAWMVKGLVPVVAALSSMIVAELPFVDGATSFSAAPPSKL